MRTTTEQGSKIMKIRQIKAREILDSRGKPTVSCQVELDDGSAGEASVPSGASVGKYEAVALPASEAIKNVNQIITPKLIGQLAYEQAKIDQLMIDLDGTENKSKLGANAILAVSLSICRAAARAQKKELYQYLGQFFSVSPKLPLPFFNLLNGGRHSPPAGGSPDWQEFMLASDKTKNFQEALKTGQEVFASLKKIFQEKDWLISYGDEGGLVPPLTKNKEVLDLLIKAVKKAGHEDKISLALDVAANELEKEMSIQDYEELVNQYPLISIEDPFSEDNWKDFAELTQRIGEKVQVVGDDLYATNLQRLEKGIETKATNAVLIKPNQIGTLTETIKVMRTARRAGMKMMISHRSGETEDSFIADLAVASGCGQIKSGAPGPKERMAKYNRLLKIEKGLA